MAAGGHFGLDDNVSYRWKTLSLENDKVGKSGKRGEKLVNVGKSGESGSKLEKVGKSD